jgi:hypothetical protein
VPRRPTRRPSRPRTAPAFTRSPATCRGCDLIRGRPCGSGSGCCGC